MTEPKHVTIALEIPTEVFNELQEIIKFHRQYRQIDLHQYLLELATDATANSKLLRSLKNKSSSCIRNYPGF
jgi:hypothetical protein